MLNFPGNVDLQASLFSNRIQSKCTVAWNICKAVFASFNCADTPKFTGGDGGVYWGCCCSWIMLIEEINQHFDSEANVSLNLTFFNKKTKDA